MLLSGNQRLKVHHRSSAIGVAEDVREKVDPVAVEQWEDATPTSIRLQAAAVVDTGVHKVERAAEVAEYVVEDFIVSWADVRGVVGKVKHLK